MCHRRSLFGMSNVFLTYSLIFWIYTIAEFHISSDKPHCVLYIIIRKLHGVHGEMSSFFITKENNLGILKII